MPGEPSRTTQRILNLDVVMYGRNVKDGAFAVGYADFPPGTPVSLDGAVQGISKTHDGKVLSSKEFILEGSTCKEFEIEINKPKGYVSGRVIVINRRFYQYFAIGTNGRLSNPDVRKFLDSFKLIK